MGINLTKICKTGGNWGISVTEADCLKEINKWQVEDVKKTFGNFDCYINAKVIKNGSKYFTATCTETEDEPNTVNLANMCVAGRGTWGSSMSEAQCMEELNAWQIEYVRPRLEDFECSTTSNVHATSSARFTVICTGTLKDIEQGRGSVK